MSSTEAYAGTCSSKAIGNKLLAIPCPEHSRVPSLSTARSPRPLGWPGRVCFLPRPLAARKARADCSPSKTALFHPIGPGGKCELFLLAGFVIMTPLCPVLSPATCHFDMPLIGGRNSVVTTADKTVPVFRNSFASNIFRRTKTLFAAFRFAEFGTHFASCINAEGRNCKACNGGSLTRHII